MDKSSTSCTANGVNPNDINTTTATLPIGIFDSGVGGLTVAREIIEQLPQESIFYFGDTLRCPYGSRSISEIREFALQISRWLVGKGIKLLVVACNSATAAALDIIHSSIPVPVIGVVEPGARAAVKATQSGRVGVIGTQATVESGVYRQAIAEIDPNIQTFSVATPLFADMVESGLHLSPPKLPQSVQDLRRLEIAQVAGMYLEPLIAKEIDTLVLGCTHYPLLAPQIRQVMGYQVRIISSADETARDVYAALHDSGQLALACRLPKHRFATTAEDVEEFAEMGSTILSRQMYDVEQVTLAELEGK